MFLLYSGPTVLTIKDADKSIATASGAIQVGKYEFVLTVKDAEDLSSTSTLTVNVKKGTSEFQIRKSTTPDVSVCVCVGGGGGVSKMLKFYVKVFYVMGKVLSGELSCPCDRSC